MPDTSVIVHMQSLPPQAAGLGAAPSDWQE